MQEIIRQIIEMDEEARKLKQKAEEEKLRSQEEIENAKQRIHEEYIEKARLRSEKNNDMEQKAADEQWEKTREKHEAVRSTLEAEFKKNYDAWVDEVVANVLGQI